MSDDESIVDNAEYQRGKEIEWDRDLRSVCIHEYAHFHVARYHDVLGWVEISPRDTENWMQEMQFTGRFKCATDISDPATARVIGLAGICAEQLDKDANEVAASIMDSLNPDYGTLTLSETDAEMAGAFDEADVEHCLKLLRALWTEIVTDAQLHIALEVGRAEGLTRHA